MKPSLIDPKDLRPHPILTAIPAPAKDDPQVCACADAIREQDGHLQPLVIDEANQILTDDSRLRWMAANRMGMREVPVVLQPGALAPVIALNALVHRSHYTKSAIAYLAVPMLQSAFEAARAARLENLRKGHKSPIAHSVGYAHNLDGLAKAIGVSPALLDSAKQVRAEFDKDRKKYSLPVEGGAEDGKITQQTLKEHFEPKILRQQVDSEHVAHRPVGLGGVMKAIGSIRRYASIGGVRPEIDQLQLFESGLKNSFRYWTELDAAEKAKARQKLQAWVASMPVEVVEEIDALIKARRKGDRSHD
jgi:hypothetical protein